MRNLGVGCTSAAVLSLLLTYNATAQPKPRAIGQVPQRIAVKPQLKLIQATGAELVVADLSGDGVDLSGDVRTSLATGSPARIRWVKPQSDDAIVVVDATTLRSGGLSLTTAAGVPLEGNVFPRGGFTLTDSTGSAFLAPSSVELLTRLDANRDGKIDQSDPVWSAIMLFRDSDADGAIGASELTSAAEVLQSLNVAASGAGSADAYNTSHVPGVGHLRDGTAIAITYARPATIQ